MGYFFKCPRDLFKSPLGNFGSKIERTIGITYLPT